ncbi:MAG TPA: choice-of-anchor tandem repeat GloVer-containing protein [Capsulimonadaceae bacterium]|nr:choice-of-anchor tandem repeat GloVer-containing protein [Capsulimonadaceae bacterium]
MKIARFAQVLSALLLVMAVSQPPGHTQTFTVLYSMGTNPKDLIYPREIGVLAQGPDGCIYSTTQQGGEYGRGGIFKITPDGKWTVLHSFNNTDGAGPQSGLTLGSDGNLYGAAYGGGRGSGTIFKITPTGAFTLLYSFLNANDGSFPISAPVEGQDGDFYGVTSYTNNQPGDAMYKITSSGKYTTLYTATRAGAATLGGRGSTLIAGSDGNFYGTTFAGGANNLGTIYKLTPDGKVTALHSFDGYHGSVAYSLIQASDGNLYGTCSEGVGYTGPSGFGLIYKLTLAGDYTVIHTFDGNSGSAPVATVIEGSDGNLYGDTRGGTGGGVIYRLAKDGTGFTVLHRFKAGEAGLDTIPLIQNTDGRFYGDSYVGGSKLTGLVYKLDAGLKPFVRPVLPWGKAGSTVGILGQGLTGTTKVTFNGTPATFKVVSDTYLTATVPIGAASGPVKAVTPTGTLTSLPFQVK